MKRLNKFPRKLRNYTCIALVVGVLGWSGSGVGDDYHFNTRGQAFEGAGPTGAYGYSTSTSTGDSQTNNEKTQNGQLTNPEQAPSAESGDSQTTSREPSKSNAEQDLGGNTKSDNAGNDSSKGNTPNSSGASGSNGPSFASPIMDSGCDTDADCKAQITGGATYEGICCLKKQDSDAIGRAGFCVDSKKTCESMNRPPDGDNPDSSDPNPPSNPGDGDNSGGDNGGFICKEDSDCKNYGCDPDGNDNIVWPACNRVTGQCYCEALQKYECRNNADCATWWGKPQRDRSTGCDSASNFKCEGAKDFKYGQCVCQSGDQSSGGDSCASKRCGDPCSGCKRDEQLSGDCTCVSVKGTEGLTCLQADLPNCSSGS